MSLEFSQLMWAQLLRTFSELISYVLDFCHLRYRHLGKTQHSMHSFLFKAWTQFGHRQCFFSIVYLTCVLPVLPLPQVFHGGRVAWPAIVVFRPKWRLLCYPTTSSRTSSNSGECCVTLDPTNTRTQSHAGTERLRQAWDYWIKNIIWQRSLSKDATVAHSSYSISKRDNYNHGCPSILAVVRWLLVHMRMKTF